jgi:hypothetical protein
MCAAPLGLANRRLVVSHEEGLNAELVKQRQLTEGYIKQTAFFEAENSKLQVQLATQGAEKDELTSKLQKNKASVQTIQSQASGCGSGCSQGRGAWGRTEEGGWATRLP